MRHIHLLDSAKVPDDDKYGFRRRAKALVDKWQDQVRTSIADTTTEPDNVAGPSNSAPTGNVATTAESPVAGPSNGTSTAVAFASTLG